MTTTKNIKAMADAAKKPKPTLSSKTVAKPARVSAVAMRDKLRTIGAASAQQAEAPAAAPTTQQDLAPWEDDVTAQAKQIETKPAANDTTPAPAPAVAEAQSVLKSLEQLGLYTGSSAPVQQPAAPTSMPPVTSAPATAPAVLTQAAPASDSLDSHPVFRRMQEAAAQAKTHPTTTGANYGAQPAGGFVFSGSSSMGAPMHHTPTVTADQEVMVPSKFTYGSNSGLGM